MRGVLCVVLAMVSAFVAAEQEKCPVSANVRGHENIEWSIAYAFHLTDANKDLPRVLLVGDSICNGYQGRVCALTEGKFGISYWISSYCVTSPEYLRLLEFHLDAAKYDVVHFNNGLHSLDTDTSAWAEALEAALKLIRAKQPQARIVWATSTPLTDEAKTAKVKELNAAARAVVEKLGDIETNDLFSLLDPMDRERNWRDVFHHNSDARELEARQVVRKICQTALEGARPTGRALPRPVPSPALLERICSGVEVYGIVHWGLNTYTDREWGFGDENPANLNPLKFDADQIVGACAAGGLQGLIVVAKHHDGFCLWPTKTTEHNIAKSPFRAGKGDYVKEMEQACRRRGLKFGVYVSPWDRNSAFYGTEKYVTDVFQAQIRELLSGDYGEIFEMWFDGANGGDGYYGGARESRRIPSGYYRYETETFAMVRKLQPKVCIFNEMDNADFRWPGNERGEIDAESRSTGGHFDSARYGDYQKWANTGLVDGVTFHPAESDFPLRPGWFYHEKDRGKTKCGAYLMKRYLGTVGNAATLNIGIAPNCEGLLDAEDVKALKDFGDLKRLFFSREVKGGEPFNVIVMQEDVAQGELVDDWKLLIDGRESLAGRSIGVKRIRILNEPLSASSVEIKVSSLTGMVPSVRSRRYYAEPGLVKAILSATTDSGETDTAQWMSGKKKPE